MNKNYRVAWQLVATLVAAISSSHLHGQSGVRSNSPLEGLAHQANSVPSPFTNVAGVYTGLLGEETTLHHSSSGALSLKLGALGTFSAKLTAGGRRHAISGRFGLDGLATNEIVVDELETQILLAVDLAGAGDQLTGTVSNAFWTSSILAFRDGFDSTHPAPQAGRYTLVLPGDPEDAALKPGGAGFATIVVSPNGTTKVAGTLGDGTRLSFKAPLSGSGWLAMYVALARGQGSFLGWLIFADNSESDVAGRLSWFGAPRRGLRYTSGFTLELDASGSSYVPAAGGSRVLPLTVGSLSFTAGNLPPFSDPIQLSAEGRATSTGTNKVTLTTRIATGLFHGSVTPPGSTKRTPFKGVVHQKGNYGAGFFLGTTETGEVRLGP